MAEPKKKTIVVTRFDPDQDEAPRQQRYEIPVEDDWKVLDALNYIKDHVDGTLSHRWSCRMAVCGSCGMNVDGTPTLTCKESLAEHGDVVGSRRSRTSPWCATSWSSSKASWRSSRR
jgi:fumarate reductase iron-sulfur subunit